MEYERIHKVQTGIISPSKLRAKLMGPHNTHMKNADSACNSSRASPSKREEDSEFVKSGLLSSMNGDGDQNAAMSKTPPHEIRDDESNGRSVVFEFHEVGRSLFLPKLNEAEKWQAHFHSKKAVPPSSNGNRFPVRVAPECHSRHDHRLPPTKHTDEVDPFDTTSAENFAFDSPSFFEIYDIHLRGKGHGHPSSACPDGNAGGVPGRHVAMRDTGTEMTPIQSQEPSATTTPVGVNTPPFSTPSSPGRQNKKLQKREEEVGEEEEKDKTRKEIAELGTQLGKTKIAEWARTGGKEYNCREDKNNSISILPEENVKRAWAWEEARKAKHFARYKREEIKIEAWESQNKAKLEAQMIGVKARVEQMRARAQAEMVKKIAMARQRSEERKAAAIMRRNKGTHRIAVEAKLLMKRGNVSPKSFIMCWKWF